MRVYRHARPAVTADVVCFAVDEDVRVLLARRGHDPYRGYWGLPGGFIEIDEELEAGARRELREETGLTVGGMIQVGAFGAVGRDPRGRTISCVFAALVLGSPPVVEGGDDAADARWFDSRRLPKLAFDHREVVDAARQRIAELVNLHGAPLPLLPHSFTAAHLARVHAAFIGSAPTAAALRRRLEAARVVRAVGRRGRSVELTVRRPARR